MTSKSMPFKINPMGAGGKSGFLKMPSGKKGLVAASFLAGTAGGGIMRME